MEPENMIEEQAAAEDLETCTSEKMGDNRSTPGKDLFAASVVALISIGIIIGAVRMPSPASFYTQPGLLPFLTGISLLAMAAGLAVRAIRMGAAKNIWKAPRASVQNYFKDIENLRTLLLIGIIVVYVVLTDQVAFELNLPMGFFDFKLSSFEVISIVTLTLILRIFWRATLTRCFLVSFGWIIAIASMFRYAFYILMPGLG